MADFKTLPYAKIFKLSVLGLFFAGGWLALFWFSNSALAEGAYRDWLTPIALLIIAIPLTALSAIAFGPKTYFLLTAALSFAFLGFFTPDFYALLGVALVFFGFWRAFHRAQFELHNNIKFAPSHIVRNVGSIILLAFMLMLSFQVYARVASDIANDEDGFYGRMANTVTKGILPIIEKQVPGFEQDLTLDQFIVNGLNKNFENNSELTPQLRQLELSASRSELSKSLGIAVSGQEPLSQVVLLVVEGQLKDLVANFERRGLPLVSLLPAVYSLAIFSLLRILSYFVGLAAQAVSVFLFWLLKATRFIRINTTQILAEQVEI